MNRIIRTALSRIATLENYTLRALPRREWAAGDGKPGDSGSQWWAQFFYSSWPWSCC